MTARKDAGQTSFVPAKVLRRLLQEQPTPFYLYDETMLREACEKLRLAFSWNAGFTPVFPVRMNQNPAVLRILASAGAQLLCASEAELRLARRADADGQRIIYAPIAIDERACGYARRIGAAQLVDGEHALPPQPPARVFLSVNPGGQLCLNGRTVWNFEKSKLGMDLQTLLSMCRRFLASGTEAISPCVFLRDQDLEPARFQAALEMLLRLAVQLYQELGIGVQSVLICGGLGASYRPSEQAPDLQAVSDFVREKYEEILAPAGLCPDLLLAAGRILAAKAGVLVTRVLAVKPQQKPVVVLDADCAQFLREIAFGATHRLMAPLVPESRQKRMVRVAGSLCDLRDHFPGTCVLPDLKLGECVIICDAGADGRSFASNYGGSPGCAEFLLDQGGDVRCIRRRQTIDELLAAFDTDAPNP